MRRRLIFMMSLLLALAAFGALTAAQDNICPVLVQDALEQMGQNCTGLGRNSACYGFTEVDSTFITDQTDDFFTTPADIAALAQLQSITTLPLDLNLEQWGIAVMSVQANVPNALPGQAVVFMLMGDTEVTNEVDPDTAVSEVEPVSVALQSESDIFSGPDQTTAIVTTLAGGSEVLADGVSADGNFLRVLTDSGLGWVAREAIDVGAQLNDLPAIDGSEQTPMQAFQVRTSFNDVNCTEAPSLLAVQSPEGLKVDITANGVNIRMGSLIMLRTLAPGNIIQVVTIKGGVTLEPGTDNELQLQPEFSTTHCLDEDGNIGDDCDWTEPVPLTEEELAWMQTVLAAYQALEQGGGPVVINGVTIIETTPDVPDTVFVPPAFNCEGFAATSPLGGLPYGSGTFFWDAPASTPDYFQVNISGENGTTSFTSSSGTDTNLIADLSVNSVGHGFNFSWNVQAIVDGEAVCTASGGSMFREAPQPPDDDDNSGSPSPQETEEPCFCESQFEG